MNQIGEFVRWNHYLSFINAKSSIILLLFISTATDISCALNDKIPPELDKLIKSNQRVSAYETFDDINPIQPIPAKLNIGSGGIEGLMRVARANRIEYEAIPSNELSDLELSINGFFLSKGVQKSLKMLSYARQLKADHPYKINPFIPYLTIRKENSLFADYKPGPLTIPWSLLMGDGFFSHTLPWKDNNKVLHNFDVIMSVSSLQNSGIMLLLDSQNFYLNDLIAHSEENILQDVIAHEFTHIWHAELLNVQQIQYMNIKSDKSHVGHDTMLVSNPTLAFVEGLAEAFEALYGTAAEMIMNMSKEEREKFYGELGTNIATNLDFLVNRQVYLRQNAFLYNLFDFDNCMLRAMPQGTQKSRINYFTFKNRFYNSTNRVTMDILEKNCQIDSSGRLEAKEGFVGTLIYKILGTGALVSDPTSPVPPAVETVQAIPAQQKKKRFASFKAFVEAELRLSPAHTGRKVAGELKSTHLKTFEKLLLLGFRNLALGIARSGATDLKMLLSYYFSDISFLDQSEQLKLAFEIMKTSAGGFMKDDSTRNIILKRFFANLTTINKNKAAIVEELDRMYSAHELNLVIGRLGEVPEIFVEFNSHQLTTKRLNINLAHFVDLSDFFGDDNDHHEQLSALAKKLDQGWHFQNETEFLDFAKSIGKGDMTRTALDTASTSLRASEKRILSSNKSGLSLNIDLNLKSIFQ